MKMIPFVKMAGAGNDFIVVDAIKGMDYKKLGRAVCDRSYGIGADGLLILNGSKTCDYGMRIVNSDGSEAEMCGNGARCMAAYIGRKTRSKSKKFSMETLAGEIRCEVKGQSVAVRLSDPTDLMENISLAVRGENLQVSYLNTGVPHTVVFVNNLNKIDVNGIGAALRFHERFRPAGTNVNFVEQDGESLINLRTYERGVEAETKACGTGSVASALITYLRLHPDKQDVKKASMDVRTRSGEILTVAFDMKGRAISNVWLKGSAKFIADGKFYY